jgi:hypothetical protein
MEIKWTLLGSWFPTLGFELSAKRTCRKYPNSGTLSPGNTNPWIVIINIISTRHDLGLARPVSSSPNNLFTALPSPLLPFGLQFNVILHKRVLSNVLN